MEEISSNGLKTLWEKEKLLVTSNLFFSHNVFKSCLLLMPNIVDANVVSSVCLRGLAQPFHPIFPHFSKLGPLRTTFQKTLKTLKILKKRLFSKIYHKNHHFMIYLTIYLNLLTEIHFLKNFLYFNAPAKSQNF